MNRNKLLIVWMAILLAFGNMTFAQVAPIDFETGGNGADWTWTSFENGANAPLAIVANPSATGVNVSETVASFTTVTTGQPWAGVESLHGAGIGSFSFDATNATVKIMVYKSVISDVGIKFAEANGEAQPEIKVANTVINEWEELTFDFSGHIGLGATGILDQIIIFPDFDLAGRTTDNICYFDNITFSAQILPPGPAAHAPIPTVLAEDVISVFSDAYTNIAGTNFYPGWGQATVASEVLIEGNNTLLYAGLNYQGIELGSAQDVSGMDSLHLDFWSANSTALEVFLISQSSGENTFVLPTPTDTWTSVAIPLTAFSDQGLGLSDIFQLKFVGNGDVYVDNIFFEGEVIVVDQGPFAPIDFEADGHGADWTWTSFENGANAPLAIVANPSATGVNVSESVASFTTVTTGQPWAGVESLHGAGIGSFSFDATNATVKIMVYKSVISDVGIKFAEANGEAQPEIKVANTVINEWEELTFDFSGHIGLGATGILDQIIIFPDFDLAGRTTDNTCYFDNITFSEQQLPSGPVAHAPLPTVPAEEVLSIFSDAYTDMAETNFNPNWGQSTQVSNEDIEGNSTLKYNNLNYQGTNLGGPEGVDQDVSAYGFLHVDFWTSNATALNFFLISRTTGEQAFALPIATEQWVSVDIPLNHFTNLGMGLTDIFQFKIDGGDGSTVVYWDNWYFHGEFIIEPDPGLFFSEYAEGSSNNKYLEIYNPTDADIDLGAYSLSSCSNGCDSTGVFDYPNNVTFAPGTILPPGEVYVITHGSATDAILAEGDQTFTYLSNGDDVFAITDTLNLNIVDIIGEMGPDPGDGWDVAGVTNATKDHTLIRKNDVMYGNIGNWEMSAGTDSLTSQWIVAAPATAEHTPATLGWHIMPPPPPAPLVGAPAPIHDAADVMSIYSGAYDNLAETNFNPNWGQSTTVTVDADVAGEPTLLYETLNYQGTNLGGPDGVDQDVSEYQFIHVDVWTSNAPAVNFTLISRGSGEQAFSLPIVLGQWVSVDIPLNHFANLGLGLTDIFQFKVDGGDGATNVWFDNWYFHTPAPPPPPPIELAGAWVMAPQAGALAVGPNPFDGSWWSNSDSDVLTRACFFDDRYVFNVDGSFHNVLDGDTWLETWQGVDGDGCGAPIAPHDGMTPATWSVDHQTRTVTLDGVGAYLGIPKAFNGGELGNPADAPASITYDVHVDSTGMISLVLDIGGGFWTYTMMPAPLPPIELEGVWVIAPEAGALSVGPGPFDDSWWSNSEADVVTRACFFDDKYVFNADGSFQNVLDGDTWLETWQGVEADGCGAPIAPHDGLTPATWSINPQSRTVTLDGVGAYLGIPKAFNGGELDDPANAQPSITYEVHLDETSRSISMVLDVGGGFWTFRMVPEMGPPPHPMVAAPTPDMNADQVLSIFSDAYTDLAETNFNPNWGQSTMVSFEEIEGNSTMQYGGLNYQGTNLGGPEGVDQDVSGYEFIHVDFWTANATALNFFLISRNTGEQAFSLPITAGEWVSVDIPLSHFTDLGMGLTDIFQFKVDGGDGATNVWFDNWYFYTTIVGVDDLVMLPEVSVLEQNYPNPFNPTTTIKYGLADASPVSIIIYDIRGNVVRTIQSASQPAGWYALNWNGLDDAGLPVSTGLYLTRLQAGSYTHTIKMLYLK